MKEIYGPVAQQYIPADIPPKTQYLPVMKTINRRNMLQLTGMGAMASFLDPLAGTKNPTRPVPGKQKIVVAGAHPDDPESGSGGTMALFAAAGHEVVSAYLTRGEAGIRGKSHDEAAAVRTKEAMNACAILEARAEFLGQIDGSTEINSSRYGDFHAFFEREKPSVVFTHWPLDTHRDHRACSLLVYDAWLTLGKPFSLYYFEVETGFQTQNFSPTDYMDITGVIERKRSACMAHVSQDPAGWYDGIHRKMEEFRGMECGCRFAEAFVSHPQNLPVRVGAGDRGD